VSHNLRLFIAYRSRFPRRLLSEVCLTVSAMRSPLDTGSDSAISASTAVPRLP